MKEIENKFFKTSSAFRSGVNYSEYFYFYKIVKVLNKDETKIECSVIGYNIEFKYKYYDNNERKLENISLNTDINNITFNLTNNELSKYYTEITEKEYHKVYSDILNDIDKLINKFDKNCTD